MLLDISRRYRMRDLIDTNFPAIIPPGQVPIWNGAVWVTGAPAPGLHAPTHVQGAIDAIIAALDARALALVNHGDIPFRAAALNTLAALAPGPAGQILTSGGPGADPFWAAAPAMVWARGKTAVVVASNAVDLVNGDYFCDGVADEVEINAAITAVALAGGGTVYLSEGTFVLAGSIVLRDNVLLTGVGHATIVQIGAAVDIASAIVAAAVAGHIGLRDFSIDGNQGAGASGGGVFFTNAPYTYISNLYIHDTGPRPAALASAAGILLETCHHSTVQHCKIENTCVGGSIVASDSGLCVQLSQYCLIEGNTCLQCSNMGFQFNTCTYTYVNDNTADLSPGNGFTLGVCNQCKILKNLSRNNTFNGYYFFLSTSTEFADNTALNNQNAGIHTNTVTHCLIANNTSQYNNQSGGANDNIYIQTSDYNLIEGNLARYDPLSMTRYGLHIGVGSLDNMVADNDLHQSGNTADYFDAGTRTLERTNRVTGGWYSAKPRTATRVVVASNAADQSYSHGYGDYFCDGVADQVQINAAIAYVNAAGGGTVHLSEGLFTISASITLLDNVWLKGSGNGTIIRFVAGVNVIQGIGEAAVSGHITVSDLQIDGNRGAGSAGSGVRFIGAPYSKITNCYIHDTQDSGFAGGSGILMDTCHYSMLLNNWLYNCGSNVWIDNGLSFINSNYCVIADNLVLQCILNGANLNNCLYCNISGNVCVSSAGFGFQIVNCLYSGITRNIAYQSVAYGFALSGAQYCFVAFNVADYNGTDGFFGSNTGGVTSNNVASRNGECGFNFNPMDGVFANNVAYSNSRGNDNTFDNIYLCCHRAIISCNIARSAVAPNRARYGMYIFQSDNNLIEGNSLRDGGATGSLCISAVSANNEVHGNDFYNNIGGAPYTDLGTATLERDNRVTEGWYSLPTQLQHWSTRYYSGPTLSYSTSTAAIVANQLYGLPFVVPKHGTYDRIAIHVTVGVAGNCRIGIYKDNNGYPGALILDSGLLAVGVAGAVEGVIAQVLPAGWYWLALVCEVAPTVRHQLCSYDTAPQELGWNAVTDISTYGGLRGAFAFAALPNPYPPGHLPWNNTSFPKITLRRQ